MPTAVITQQFNWDTRTAIERKDAVRSLREHPGWDALQAAVEQRKLTLIEQLANSPVSFNPGEYERILGEIRGIDSLDGILEGIVRYGATAERELRELEESAK